MGSQESEGERRQPAHRLRRQSALGSGRLLAPEPRARRNELWLRAGGGERGGSHLHEELLHDARSPRQAHVRTLRRVGHVRAVQRHLEHHLCVLRRLRLKAVGRDLGHELGQLVKVAAHVCAEHHADHHLAHGRHVRGQHAREDVVLRRVEQRPRPRDVHVLENGLVVVQDRHLQTVLHVEQVVQAGVAKVCAHGGRASRQSCGARGGEARRARAVRACPAPASCAHGAQACDAAPSVANDTRCHR